ncbi:MAG: hypothetical protein QOF25_5535 [Mycobacterium sp.]|jgi:uncharacterized protein with LGFP repeats|nr:hypothetical protein [Mycobacterium sp.]
MTGLRTLLGDVTRRAGVGLALAAAVVLLAPVAAATPESDADGAINAAWDAGGGTTGPLGPKDGNVYAIGGGFGQNFAGGKVFFTPDTGAHIMQGAILDKYLSLGGPADGDLGFPTIDEGAGKAPDSRNTTFSAADNPVIFFTPDTGARVVRGAINAAWDKLGGSAGALGVPTEDEVYRGEVASQNFSGGQLSWDSKTKVFTTTPPELADQLAGLPVPGDATSAINAARRAAGGPLGQLGAAEGPPSTVGTDGLAQTFAGGKIFYSPDTGADVVTGQVLAKYESVGGPAGDLGFPTSSEADGGLAPMSRITTFAAADQPVIFWTPDYGAVIVRGAMNVAWAKLGGATGDLGAPTADQTENGDLVSQKFNGGAISWDKSTNEFTTEPANLASALSGLKVPGQDVPHAPPAVQASNDDGGGSSSWYSKLHWWWLFAIIPVVLVVAAIAVAVVLNRRQGDDRAPLDRFDEYDDHEDRDFDSGQVPLADHGSAGDDAYAPLSAWVMHSDDQGNHHEDTGDRRVDPGGDQDDAPDSEPTARLEGFPNDQDSIDTAPTRIEAASQAETEAEADAKEEPEPASGPPSGRHAAIVLEEPVSAQTALRLALDDPYQAPEGYPVKADTTTGVYWTPGSGHYDRARAEIWFASEEFALTNGFVKG